MATDPKSRARDAFADLPTAEKTAFVIEATFNTIGEAIRETGQRLGAVITEFDPDEFFRWPEETEADPTPEPAARTAAAKKPAATKSAATKKAASATKTSARKTTGATKTTASKKATGKTAGRKKKDDDA